MDIFPTSEIDHRATSSPDRPGLSKGRKGCPPSEPFLEAYFARQGVILERTLVHGEVVLSLPYPDGSNLFGINGCRFGWSAEELWSKWCQLQDRLNWHERCARHLVHHALDVGGNAEARFRQWIASGGTWDGESNVDRMPWPWSALHRFPGQRLLTFQGDPWNREPLGVTPPLIILELANACITDVFDPREAAVYVRAMQRLLIDEENVRLNIALPDVQRQGCIRRI